MKIKGRYILPIGVVAGVGVIGLFTSPGSATTTTTSSPSMTVSPSMTAAPIAATVSGGPITYYTPDSKSQIMNGETLFLENCSTCHSRPGDQAGGGNPAGGPGIVAGPNLRGVGAATIDFWVSTGRMPLAVNSAEATRKPPRFDRTQTLEIIAYVNSLASNSLDRPGIPTVNLSTADLAQGNSLFVLNCAACHTITGSGDALANGATAPTMHKADTTQIAEAIRTGPGNMPWFGPHEFTDQQVADIVAYVHDVIQQPDNRGGLGLGGIGPVTEGFVALLIGVGALMLVAFWLGERA